ncbi:porin family protein [Rhodanobacter sp. DHB23]|uniref:porin family protein n=1 Tax=Rhodanobacter sp. DHB23 TaxID=2775923 RepID=UPI00177B4553|nr:porin family protein [Rhodanobacter sp. DHB23]MBD8874423.1 porin family protein [Rhodanobacter sp. DHB23]
MNKALVAGAIAVMLIAPLTTRADDSTNNGDRLDNFYVAGNLGQTKYRTDISHPNSVFQNVRFGWRWNDYIGAEVGYAYLGHRKDVINRAGTLLPTLPPSIVTSPSLPPSFSAAPIHRETSVNSRAATIGVNGRYNFYRNWFVTGHAGYLRSRRTNEVNYYVLGTSSDHTSWNNGWYGGLGVGYDLTRNVSLALNYDNYHLQYGHPGSFRDDVNVAAFSASLEYRF